MVKELTLENEAATIETAGNQVRECSGRAQKKDVVLNAKHFPRPGCIAYFKEADLGTGLMYLARKAILQSDNATDELDPEDVETFLETAFFVSRISRPQREALASLLSRVCYTVSKQCERKHLAEQGKTDEPERKRQRAELKNENQLDVKILTTKEEMRSRFISGKYALFPNLPHPEVHTLDGHAFVLPTECLADFMAHGLADVTVTQGEQSLKHQTLPFCTKAREIVEQNQERGCRTVFGSIWSDGFDPNTKLNNRGSAWVMTLTLETEVTETVTIKNVYPLVVGKESEDHRKITELIWDDLASLVSTSGNELIMYSGKERKDEKVSLHMIAISQDQPERRDSTCLLRGNSTYHARFGYSVNVKQISKLMRPCVFCWGAMKSVSGDDIWEPRDCEHCFNWMAKEDKVIFDAEAEFPREMLPESGKLQLRRLTFDGLKEAVATTHQKVETEAWDVKTGMAYLTVWCIPEKFRKEIISCAENCRALTKAHREMNVEVMEALNMEQAEHPELYQPWKPPPIWRSGLDIWSIHETAMHLLFLGICQSIIFELQNWAILRKKMTSLGKHLLYLTGKIERFHLSWCRVNQYKGERLGGWISENYLAHARLFVWYYSGLHDLTDDAPYEPPNKPRGRWNMAENKAWLRSRRLPVNGNAEELKERVAGNFELPEAPPTGAPLTKVSDVIFTFWSLVSQLMGMKEGNTVAANVSSRLIRIFLTAVYDMDELMAVPMERKLPMWLSQYNFLCLLNLPEQIEMLGPVRNRWEGGVRGERFLQKAKPNVRSTRLKNWAQNLMLNLLRQRELFVLHNTMNMSAWITDEMDDEDEDEVDDEPDLAAFVTYRSRADVIREIDNEEPLSVVITSEEGQQPKTFACYRGRNRGILTCELERSGTPRYFFGMNYHQFKLTSMDSEVDLPITTLKVVSYGLLLPILKDDDVRYALVDSNWKVLDDHGQLVQPHLYLDSDTRH